MAWFGDSISSFTGQISNFTKEVLTENPDEVYDDDAEFQFAKRRLKELEPLMTFQKQEIERLQHQCNKLEERSQTAELQLQALSQQYRTLLEEKEKEIKVLKQKLSTSTTYLEFKLDANEDYAADDGAPDNTNRVDPLAMQQHGVDFEDVVSGQHEMNRLNRLVNKLRRERDYWRQVAGNQPTASASQVQPPIAAGVSSSASLPVALPSPSASFASRNAPAAQAYLAASTSNRSHVHDDCGASPETRRPPSTTLPNTEDPSPDNRQVAAGEHYDGNESDADELWNLRRRLKETKAQLRCEIECRQYELASLQELHEHQMAVLQTKYETELDRLKANQHESNMQSSADELNEPEDIHEVNNSSRGKQLQDTKKELYYAKSECQRLSASVSVLEDEKREKETTIQRLVRKVDKLQREKRNIGKSLQTAGLIPNLNLKTGTKVPGLGDETFPLAVEAAKDVAMIEKEQNEEEDARNDKVKEMDVPAGKLFPEGSVDWSKIPGGLTRAQSELELDVYRLQGEVTTLSTKCENLEEEKGTLNEELEKLRHALAEGEELLKNKTDDNKELETVQSRLQTLEEEVVKLVSERDSLENSLVELDGQHQQAVEQILTSRDAVQRNYKQLLAEDEALQAEVAQTQLQMLEASKEIADIWSLLLSCRLSSEELPAAQSEDGLLQNLQALKEVVQHVSRDIQRTDETRLRQLEGKQSVGTGQDPTSAETDALTFQVQCRALEAELQRTKDLAEERAAATRTALEELEISRTEALELKPALENVRDVVHVDVQTGPDMVAAEGEDPGAISRDDDGGIGSHEALLQEQVSEMHVLITSLENQLREKERHLSSVSDILKVYKENLDPDQELAKEKQAEMVRKYETRIQTLETERDRMMAVLNDKARENSSLKLEVHRLMSVVSAERSALAKLQRDCEEMSRRKAGLDSETEDMTKEAMHSLARLVRDREVEIEALRQRNGTLLSLLQETDEEALPGGSSAADGVAHEMNRSSAVQTLLAEREELSRQVERHQTEREQLINALNQKHQESVAYHAEIQRLLGMLERDGKQYETLQQEHLAVVRQFENKQQALLENQNESLAVKHKVTTLEQQLEALQVKYDRLLNEEAQGENQSEGSDQVISEPATVRVDTEEWNARLEEVNRLNRAIQEKDKSLYEKDCIVHEKMRNIESIKELLQRKEQELNMMKQRFAHLNQQLETSQSETEATREQNSAMRTRMEDSRAEIAVLRETNSTLSVTLQEREFELKALREKVGTLSQLIEQQASKANRGEEEERTLKRLLSESEEMRHKAQGFQAERDQALLALAHKQRENEELQEQIRAPKEQEERLLKELNRLRYHLLQVEESYTQEALQAEQREKELRNRLAVSEDRIQMATSSHSAASHHAYLQVESLQEQLKTVVEQRDDILVKLSVAEDQVAQKSAALHTLQVVLEQLQQERQRDVAAVQFQYAKKLDGEKQQTKKFQAEITALEARLHEASEALEAASRLSEQLDRKEETIRTLHEEVGFQEMALQKAKQEIHHLAGNHEITVDRTIVKNLVVGFITVPRGQQKEVLRVIATVLDFNKEEREKVGVDEVTVGWISSWLIRKPPASPVYRPSRKPTQQSLSEAFVRFLENESLPPPQVKLPIESLAAAERESPTGQVQQQSVVATNRSMRTNPFAFALHPQTDPVPSLMGPSHLLLKPMTTALPMFSPAPVSEWSSSTNSVLRDVLRKE